MEFQYVPSLFPFSVESVFASSCTRSVSVLCTRRCLYSFSYAARPDFSLLVLSFPLFALVNISRTMVPSASVYASFLFWNVHALLDIGE